ncbi:ribonuclease H-like domain-containing protein [Tanacetum coccineum]
MAFGGGAKGGRITGKGTFKTGKLDFEDVYFVKELKFNLFSVSQMCDNKNSSLFTKTGCFVLSPDFKLTDESQVLFKVPGKNNMYSVDMKSTIPKESLTCLVAKATLDESMLWHRRLGYINFKNINKLVKENLVRGFPSKHFENDQTCVACLKGKQHGASSTKDETSGILKSFITEIENLVDKKVKIIRCDNGTEFKNRVMSKFCEKKGIKKEFSVARTPQQNGVAERRNRTHIEAARTIGIKPALGFMKPFGCHVLILNTIDHLGKFDGKIDEGFFVGYSISSKAFRVYNIRTRKVKENLHVKFLENKPMIAGDGPKWLFDIDSLTKSMNYKDDENLSKEDGTCDHEKTKKELRTNDVNTVGININTASTNINIGSANINTISLPVNTVSSSGYQTQPEVTPLKKNATFEATYEDFFSDEADMTNITNSYTVLTTPNTRIHKDQSLKNVIGDVQSGVQTKKMTKLDDEQSFSLFHVLVMFFISCLAETNRALFDLLEVEAESVAGYNVESSWHRSLWFHLVVAGAAETVVRFPEVVEQKIPAYLELIGEELVVATLNSSLSMEDFDEEAAKNR